MKEFVPKANIDKDGDRKNKESLEDQKIDLKVFIREISKEISECEPDSLEFFKLKNSFIKAAPIFRESIKEYIELSKEYLFIMDSEKEDYFRLADKLDLMEEEDREIFFQVFRRGQVYGQLIDNILEKKEFYLNQNEIERDKEKEEIKEAKEELLEFILERFGFSEIEVKKLIKSWLTIEDDEIARWYVARNLQNINFLENREVGSAKYLFDNFGIRGFGRYEIHELNKQYRERENMGPYGIYYQAVMDWNGSFINSNNSEDLGRKIEKQGFLMRIIEADGKIDSAKRLLSLRDKYEQKIKFMYVHAHGNTDVIGLGDDKISNNRLFEQKDLKGKGVQRVKDLFEDDAEVILSSCLTGVKGGLAEEIANTYGVKVIAADKPTVCRPISVDIEKTKDGNNLEFDIIFNTVDLEVAEEREDKKRSDLLGTVIYNPKGR